MGDEDRVIPVKQLVPDDMATIYANNITVTHTQGMFILSFFELRDPLLMGGTKEEKVEQIRKLEFVPSICVGRIAIAPDRMEPIAKAIMNNYRTYAERKGEAE